MMKYGGMGGRELVLVSAYHDNMQQKECFVWPLQERTGRPEWLTSVSHCGEKQEYASQV